MILTQSSTRTRKFSPIPSGARQGAAGRNHRSSARPAADSIACRMGDWRPSENSSSRLRTRYTRSRSILSIRTREREAIMPITLTQQTALITGASRGIGRGIALKLAEQGVKRIAINYKENDAAAEDAARLLKERGAAPLLIKADIGKVADIQRMFETIKSQFGGLDIFVSNARATLATETKMSRPPNWDLMVSNMRWMSATLPISALITRGAAPRSLRRRAASSAAASFSL